MADIKSLKAMKFLDVLSHRQAKFEVAQPEFPNFSDNASVLAKALHPKRQYLKIESVQERGEDCKSFTLVPDEEAGTTALAYFGAGKYLTVFETIEGMPVTRAYSISSSRDLISHSRQGATMGILGAKCLMVSSNRTWSLPLPVQPWQIASAPSLMAISTKPLAMQGRA